MFFSSMKIPNVFLFRHHRKTEQKPSGNSSKTKEFARVPAHTGCIAGDSHCGFVRSANEDSFGFFSDEKKHVAIIAVADGIGSGVRGDIASSYALKLLLSAWRTFSDDTQQLTQEDTAEFLYKKIKSINQALHSLNMKSGMKLPSGTTLTCAVITPNFVVTANAGDSRIYRIRNGILEQLTEDNSAIAKLLKEGVITPDQAETHPMAHVVLKCLGPASVMAPDVKIFDRLHEDRFLACSDGLLLHVSDREIQSIMQDSDSAKNIVKTLITKALRDGGEDNVTVISYFQT